MTTKTKSMFALAAIALCSASARADDAQSMFKFSGFGTLGAVHSDLDTADFTGGGFKPNGPGATRSVSWGVDSRLGAQLDARLSNKLSAVVQVIAEQRYDNSTTPYVEWANLKYEVTPEFSVRAGRIALPTYVLSDSRKVGFANLAVRAPEPFYTILPITNNDGVDLSYRVSRGDVINTTTVFFGRNTIKIPKPLTEAKGTSMHGIVNNTEYGAMTFHVGYHEATVTLEPNIVKWPNKVLTMGLQYDPGTWYAIAEVIQTRMNRINDRRGAYVMGGYHVGQFTPYVGYMRISQLNEILFDESQTVGTLGVKWNFAKNADLKLQYEHVDLGPRANGRLLTTPAFQRGSNFQLLSAAVDFVF